MTPEQALPFIFNGFFWLGVWLGYLRGYKNGLKDGNRPPWER